MNSIYKTVTFGVIAHNEEKYLPDLLEDLNNQTYPKELIEVILVDGISTDNTIKIMQEFRKNGKGIYKKIIVLDNPKRVQPCGWNIVINHFNCDVLLRIDAHARLPKNFIEMNMKCINSGEYVCGGPRENIIDSTTPWKKILLSAEKSMFGAGFATYRKKTEETKYVKSVFHAAYRREVIEKVGLFNESLIRTEDNEYHYRVREAGYRICYDPEIQSLYQTRSSLKGMLKQKYLNGFWIGRTLFVCPGCISIFHLAPALFVIVLFISILFALAGLTVPLVLLGSTYAIANLIMTIGVLINIKEINLQAFLLPFVFLSLHLSYGIGTIVGIGSMAEILKRDRMSK